MHQPKISHPTITSQKKSLQTNQSNQQLGSTSIVVLAIQSNLKHILIAKENYMATNNDINLIRYKHSSIQM